MKKASKITGTLCLVAASLALSLSAQAQSNSANTRGGNYAYPSNNTYIGLSVGKSDFSLGSSSGIFSTDQNDTSYRLNAGNYFNPNWGADIAYTDFGKISRSGGTTKADALSLSLIGKYPMSNSVKLLGKLGASFGRTSVTSSAASGVLAGDTTGVGILYGLGFEFAMSPQWSALLEYDSHNLKFAGDRFERVGAATVGIRYAY
jgi:OOP family OmpA-OmpF porin